MITKELIMKLFDAAYMQRWNDKLRPMDLVEMDKQAHKMFIAFLLGKFQEQTEEVNWQAIIEGGIFELLERLVITDIKPGVFERIKSDKERYKRLKAYSYEKLREYIDPIAGGFSERYASYLELPEDDKVKRILGASHCMSSRWEFKIIERTNPEDYEVDRIHREFEDKLDGYNDLKGVVQVKLNHRYSEFIDLCGALRYQYRWASIHRVPRTSVLGHSLMVAVLSYLFSLEEGACDKRCYNNFYTGLFHDLPEVLTRDIISPVKRSVEGLDDLIKEIEEEMMEDTLYPLIPKELKEEIRFFTQEEFSNKVTIDGVPCYKSCREISLHYNSAPYSPRDGEIVRACDMLSAFTEAYAAIENGCISKELKNAIVSIRKSYGDKSLTDAVSFKPIYDAFV